MKTFKHGQTFSVSNEPGKNKPDKFFTQRKRHTIVRTDSHAKLLWGMFQMDVRTFWSEYYSCYDLYIILTQESLKRFETNRTIL